MTLVLCAIPTSLKSLEHEQSVTIRFVFSLQWLSLSDPRGDIVNTYAVWIDGEKVIDHTFIDNSGGHDPQIQPYIEVEKGQHVMEVLLRENGLRRRMDIDLKASIGYVISYNQEGRIDIGEVPFDTIFIIE